VTRADSKVWRWWVAAGALAAAVGAPAGALGGAWTLPQGTGQVIATLNVLCNINKLDGRGGWLLPAC
jgi:hypothetical protein